MQINKGDRIDVIGDTSYKATKEFDLEAAVNLFSDDYCFVEETLTKDSHVIFLEQLAGWLLKNDYIKPTAKAVVRINVSSFRSDDPHVTATHRLEGNYSEMKIPLKIDVEEQSKYIFNCRWRIDRSKSVIRN